MPEEAMPPEKRQLSRVHELVREMKVGETMTREVVTVGPDTPMAELRDVLRSRRISGTPVVEGDEVVGMISIEDFINWLCEGGRDVPIRDMMTREVAVVRTEERLIHAVRKLDETGFGRLPVVNQEPRLQRPRLTGCRGRPLEAPLLSDGREKLVGIITKGDIIEGLLKKLEIDYHEEEVQRYTGDWIFDDVFADRAGLNLEYHVAGGDVRNGGTCASRLRKTLSHLGLRPQTLRRVAIATYEAEMNAAIHAGGGEITASVGPAEVVIVVTDSGPGIPDVDEAMRPGYSTAAEWVRELGFGAGMGLDNIRNCADEMKLTSEIGVGTRLEARITMDGSVA